MKKCTKCKQEKELSSFTKDKSRKEGLQCWCRSCSQEYRHSKEAQAHILYGHQIGNSKHRKMELPSYSLEDFVKWLDNQPLFDTLYNNWVLSGYKKELKPSVDRNNDYLGYSLDNIKLVIWRQNRIKGNVDRRNGINNKGSKSVLQFSLNGEFIKRYHSIRQAGREANINSGHICQCCLGRQNTAGGFNWEHGTL